MPFVGAAKYDIQKSDVNAVGSIGSDTPTKTDFGSNELPQEEMDQLESGSKKVTEIPIKEQSIWNKSKNFFANKRREHTKALANIYGLDPTTVDNVFSNINTKTLNTLKNVAKVYPVVEVAANLASSTYGIPASGYGALLGLIDNPETAGKFQNYVEEKTIVKPKTKGGKELLETIMSPFALYSEGLSKAQEKLESKGYGKTGLVTKIIGEAIPAVYFTAKGLRLPSKMRTYWESLKPAERNLMVIDAINMTENPTLQSVGQKIRSNIRKAGGLETPEGAGIMAEQVNKYARGKKSTEVVVNKKTTTSPETPFTSEKVKTAFNNREEHTLVAEDVTIQKEFESLDKGITTEVTDNIWNNLKPAEQARFVDRVNRESGTIVVKAPDLRRIPQSAKTSIKEFLSMKLTEADLTNEMKLERTISNLEDALKGIDGTEPLAENGLFEDVKIRKLRMDASQLSPDQINEYKSLGLKVRKVINEATIRGKAKTPQEKKLYDIWDNYANSHLLEDTIDLSPALKVFTQQSGSTVFELFGDYDSFVKDMEAAGTSRKAIQKAKQTSLLNIAYELRDIHSSAIKSGMTVEDYLVSTKKATATQAVQVARYMDNVLDFTDPHRVIINKVPIAKGNPDTYDAYLSKQKAAELAANKKDWLDGINELQKAFINNDPKVREFFNDMLTNKSLTSLERLAAQKALDRYVLVRGAMPAAKNFFNNVYGETFGLLKNSREVDLVNGIIQATNEISIAERHPTRKINPLEPPIVDKQAWLDKIVRNSTLPTTRQNIVLKVVDNYFNVMKQLREFKNTEGAFSPRLNALLDENPYSPVKWLKAMDMFNNELIQGNMSIRDAMGSMADVEKYISEGIKNAGATGNVQVKTSGVYRLTQGMEGYKKLDAQGLMAELSNEVHSWVFRNRAGKAIGDLARVLDDSEHPIIRKAPISSWGVDEHGYFKPNYKKPPEGFRELNYFEDGQLKAVHIEQIFANQFNTSSVVGQQVAMDILRHVSLASTVKFMATGPGNPFFGITKGLIMDTAYNYMVAKRRIPGEVKTMSLYSPEPWKFPVEILSNISEVFDDVVNRKGLFQDIVKEGGLFGTTSTVGRLRAESQSRMGHGLTVIADYANWFNTTSEYLIRAASVRQFEKSGYDRVSAIAMMRDTLDFSQGGWLVKEFIDPIVPYTNVSIQVVRKSTESIKEDIKSNWGKNTAIKAATMAALGGSLYLWNWLKNPDAVKSESEENRRNNFILHTGFSFEDANGDTNYVNLKLKKDSVVGLYANMAELLIARALGDEEDFGSIAKNIFSYGSPLQRIPNMPIANAFITYAYGKDWSGRDIWNNKYVTTEAWNPEKTSKLWYDLGQVLKLNPEKLRESAEAVITKNSLLKTGIETSYDALFNSLEKKQQESLGLEWLKSSYSPGVISITKKGNVIGGKKIESANEETANQYAINDLITKISAQTFYDDTKDKVTQDKALETFMEHLKKVGETNKQEYERLTNNFKNFGYTKYVKEPTLWRRFGGLVDEYDRGYAIGEYMNTIKSDKELENFMQSWGTLKEQGSNIVSDSERFKQGFIAGQTNNKERSK